MNWIPYKKMKYTSKKSPADIINVLSKLISKPDRDITISKLINNRVVEGIIFDGSFVVVVGRYGLTYGKNSLLPIMKGKIARDPLRSESLITVVVRPFTTGILVLGIFYLLGFAGMYFAISRGLLQGCIVCCIFFLSTYFLLISKFNKELKVYVNIINAVL